MHAYLVVVKGKVCHFLKLVRLVSISLFRAEVVHAVTPGSVALAQELLYLGHWVAVQSCVNHIASNLRGRIS